MKIPKYFLQRNLENFNHLNPCLSGVEKAKRKFCEATEHERKARNAPDQNDMLTFLSFYAGNFLHLHCLKLS